MITANYPENVQTYGCLGNEQQSTEKRCDTVRELCNTGGKQKPKECAFDSVTSSLSKDGGSSGTLQLGVNASMHLTVHCKQKCIILLS